MNLILGVIVVFLNGQPIASEIVGTETTMDGCKARIVSVLEKAHKTDLSHGLQFQGKCYDFGNDAFVASFIVPEGVTK